MLSTREKKRKPSRFDLLYDGKRMQMRPARSTTLDWQLLDDDKPRDAQVDVPARDSSGASPAGARTRGLRAIVGLLVVLVASAALYMWRTAETGAQLLEDELRTTVAAEQGLSSDPRSGLDAHELPAIASTVQVQAIAYRGNVASVQVETTHTEPDGHSYRTRQRHFYQPTASGWVRVPPTSAHLGASEIHQTEFFTWYYHSIDGAAVAVVAAELDAMYAEMRHDYGLPPAVERVFVEVLTETTASKIACHRANQLCIDSPALAALPPDLSETEALRLWILNALVYQVRWDAIKFAPFRYGWQNAAHALPRLQLRRYSPRMAAWQHDLARWLYRIEARTSKPDEARLAQELARLCDTHRVVAYQRLFVGGASNHLCVDPPMWDLRNVAKYIAYKPPDRLGQLLMPDPELMVSDASWMQVLAFDTLLDYVVATYGRDALPALVEGFRRYDSWTTLIPAVFDVSAEEFAAGWQGYLLTLN